MDTVRIFTHPSEIFCPDYHFLFHFWPQQRLNSKNFQCYATFVRTMHLAFLKKSPVLSGFPPSIFPKFDEICPDRDAYINRGPPISLPSRKMEFLQRLLAFITRRRQSTGQSTTGTHPPQAASTTSMFHGVRTVFIIGGTFTTIVNGKPQIRAPSSRSMRRMERSSGTSSSRRTTSTTGTRTKFRCCSTRP